MNVRDLFFKLVLLACAGVILLVAFGHFRKPVKLHKVPLLGGLEYIASHFEAFLVDTPVCKIMNVDPFDLTIARFSSKGEPLNCGTANPSITFRKGTHLFLDWRAIQRPPYNGNIKHCKYQPIFRPHNVSRSHNYYKYLPSSKPFNSSISAEHEFIKVECYNNNAQKLYTNFHSFIFPKSHVESRCEDTMRRHLQQSTYSEKLNVLMLAVDSVSRLNSMRQMPKTRSYLLNDLQAVELMGYNKVADNTFVNIVPMTTGKFVEELPWNETLNTQTMDKYSFVWNQYAAHGYRTLYAEDAPNIAIFDYLKAGFARPPADYFNRHFSLAMEDESNVWSRDHNCVGDRLETDIVLDYVHQFSSTFRSRPHFVFAFISRLTHDSLQSSAAADMPYRQFLQKMKEQGLLNNSVLIFFSDHGMRFGGIRETYIGKLEERLPFMFLVFPDWFMKKYPHIAKSLRVNSHRLTTPFDIYETLQAISHFNGHVKKTTVSKRGLNLLTDVPTERTCNDAGILPHWCTCQQHEVVTNSSKIVRTASDLVVRKLNLILLDHKTACANLTLKEIHTSLKVIVSDKVLRFESSVNDVIDRTVSYDKRVLAFVDYQMTVRTKPGDGLFEATVRHDESGNTFSLIGDISRINKYGNQSHCADNHIIKKYCYCNMQLTY